MKKIAPSILSADFTKLGEEIKAVEEGGADYIHIDVMDGHFVPNITIGPLIVESANKVTELPLDVHLMISEPYRYIKDFISAGANIISVHQEVCTHLHRTVEYIRELGASPAVALNPSTPISTLDHILEYVDMILIMTVNPGFGGQELIESVIGKIVKMKRIIDERRLNIEIEVDGGIKVNNIKKPFKAGADIFVSGSGIFGSSNYKRTIQMMKREIGCLE
jgi:ribulose-phosphate 3-epimerase